MRPELTNTIEDFIDSYSSNSISYESTSFLQKISTDIMISYNIFNDYIDELIDMSVTVVLSDEEYNKYVFRPKILAYDVYGSTELFFVVMILNNICNVKEFNFKKLRLLRVDDLEKILSSIYNSEKYVLGINRTKIEDGV